MKNFINRLVNIPYCRVVTYPDAAFLQFTRGAGVSSYHRTQTPLHRRGNRGLCHNRSILAPSSTNLYSTHFFTLVIKWTYPKSNAHPSGP